MVVGATAALIRQFQKKANTIHHFKPGDRDRGIRVRLREESRSER